MTTITTARLAPHSWLPLAFFPVHGTGPVRTGRSSSQGEDSPRHSGRLADARLTLAGQICFNEFLKFFGKGGAGDTHLTSQIRSMPLPKARELIRDRIESKLESGGEQLPGRAGAVCP